MFVRFLSIVGVLEHGVWLSFLLAILVLVVGRQMVCDGCGGVQVVECIIPAGDGN